jgi:hypothetical protein
MAIKKKTRNSDVVVQVSLRGLNLRPPEIEQITKAVKQAVLGELGKLDHTSDVVVSPLPTSGSAEPALDVGGVIRFIGLILSDASRA